MSKRLFASAVVGAMLVISAVLVVSLIGGDDKPDITNDVPQEDEQLPDDSQDDTPVDDDPSDIDDTTDAETATDDESESDDTSDETDDDEAPATLQVEALQVVATEVGGIPEVVESGATGYLVPKGSAEFLAKRIVELLQDPAKAQAMALAGRAMVRDKFPAEKMIAGIEKIYDEVLG